jgi:hypothetical protein
MKWLTEFKVDEIEFINRKIAKIKTDPNKLAYLYFYEDEDNKGNINKGYIGVTNNYERRFSEHGDRFYSDISNIKPVILFESTLELCLKLENYLRPLPNMGWNIAIGGGFYLETLDSVNKAKITRRKRKEVEGGYVGDHLNTERSISKRVITQMENSRKLGINRASHMHTPDKRLKALETKITNFKRLNLDPFYMIRTKESISKGVETRRVKAESDGKVISYWLQSKESREKAVISKSKTIYKYNFKGELIDTYFNEKSYSEITGNNSSVARSNQDPYYMYTKDKNINIRNLLGYKINKSNNYIEVDKDFNIISIANRNSKMNGLSFAEYKKLSTNKFLSKKEFLDLNKSSETIL